MTDSLKVGLAQLNPKVGDVAGNLAKVRAARAEAAKQGADLVLCAESVLSGYPAEDLWLKPDFQAACRDAVEALRADTLDGGPALFVTAPWAEDGKLYNAIVALDKGEILGKRYKVDLPNYGVFDDKRVFAAGPMPGPLVFKGVRIGVPICEDVWTPDVVECISETGGEILLVLGLGCWAVYSILSQRWFTPETPQLQRTFLGLFGASPWLLVWWFLARAAGMTETINLHPSATALTYLLLTTVFATALGGVVWNIGVARLGVNAGMMWQNTVPVFAVLISLLCFGVKPLPEQVAGGVTVLAGVFYMQWHRIQAARIAPAART